VSEAACFGIPKTPNCILQQLMPTSGFTVPETLSRAHHQGY
jgi:hypothetical protein